MEPKPLDELQELLKEPSNTEHNFDKIKELVAKSSKMRLEEKERTKQTEENFKILRERIDYNSAYLEKARKELENINFAYQKTRINNDHNNLDYEEFLNKTDEEIDTEMELVKEQLAVLEDKVKTINEDTYGAEENLAKSIKTLENISKGIYKAE